MNDAILAAMPGADPSRARPRRPGLAGRLPSLVPAALLAAALPALALAGPNHGEATAIGRPGDAHHVSRTIEVRMGEMFFEPSSVTTEPGETIRFVIVNESASVHEFNLGSAETWDAHAPEMERMMDAGVIDFDRIDHGRMMQMGMMHDDSNSVLLEPGETAEIIWEFPDHHVEIGFACTVPGHLESGMVGDISYDGGS